MKKISVITPIYNEYENISDCCTSVKKFFEKEKNTNMSISWLTTVQMITVWN